MYPFGDVKTGAIGNKFNKETDRCDFNKPTSINLWNVENIYATNYCSFLLMKSGNKATKRGNVYCFGVNKD